jgi:hypothetical protein
MATHSTPSEPHGVGLLQKHSSAKQALLLMPRGSINKGVGISIGVKKNYLQTGK